MSDSSTEHCRECGAVLLRNRRFCIACQAPVPGVAQRPSGAVGEVVRHMPSTQRPDETLVFVPEVREARLQRERRWRRSLLVGLVVVVLLSIAGGIYWRVQEQKKRQAVGSRRVEMAQRELDQYAKALDFFFADVGRYPSLQEGLGALLRHPSSLAAWRGPYVDGDFSVDPWGNDYVYRVYRDGAAYELFTYGPEGEGAERVFLRVSAGLEPGR